MLEAYHSAGGGAPMVHQDWLEVSDNTILVCKQMIRMFLCFGAGKSTNTKLHIRKNVFKIIN